MRPVNNKVNSKYTTLHMYRKKDKYMYKIYFCIIRKMIYEKCYLSLRKGNDKMYTHTHI